MGDVGHAGGVDSGDGDPGGGVDVDDDDVAVRTTVGADYDDNE